MILKLPRTLDTQEDAHAIISIVNEFYQSVLN